MEVCMEQKTITKHIVSGVCSGSLAALAIWTFLLIQEAFSIRDTGAAQAFIQFGGLDLSTITKANNSLQIQQHIGLLWHFGIWIIGCTLLSILGRAVITKHHRE